MFDIDSHIKNFRPRTKNEIWLDNRWRAEYLPSGFRPLLKGEKRDDCTQCLYMGKGVSHWGDWRDEDKEDPREYLFRTTNPMPKLEYKPLSHTLFEGKFGEELNALRSALTTAAKNAGHTGEYPEYDWMGNAPRTSMIVELVDALHEHGYSIVKL